MGKLSSLIRPDRFKPFEEEKKPFVTQAEKAREIVSDISAKPKLSDIVRKKAETQPTFESEPMKRLGSFIERGKQRKSDIERRGELVDVTLGEGQPLTPQTRDFERQQLISSTFEPKQQERMLGTGSFISEKPTKVLGFELPKASEISSALQQLPDKGLITRKGAETAFGLAASIPGVSDSEGLQALKEGQSKAFKVPFTDIEVGTVDLGKGIGDLAGMLASYGVANNASKATGLGKALTGQIGKVIKNPRAAEFASTQVIDFMIDKLVQEPGEIKRATEQGLSVDEYLEGLKNRSIVDVAFNLAIGGVVEGVDILKTLKNSPDKEIVDLVDETFKSLPESTAKQNITNQTGIGGELVGTTKQVEPTIAREQAQALNIDRPFVDDIPEETLLVNLPTVANGEPIDTKSLITTELPKRAKATLSDKYDRFMQEVVSKYRPVEKLGEKARAQSSNLNRTLGSIEYNTIGKQTNMAGDEIGKSISDIFSNVKETDKPELFEYIFHKHNIDRATEGKPVFGETIDADFSRDFVRNFEAANPGAVETQQDIVKYFNNLLNEWAVPSGLTSKETADMLNQLYSNYVPTIRVKNMPKAISKGNQTVAQILKRAKGGEDKILPLDQMMIMQTDRVIKNARKNEVLNTIADVFEKDPTGTVSKYVKEIKGGQLETIDDAFDIGKSLEVEPEVIGNDFVINFYKDGEPRQMVVNKTMYEAFKPANYDNVVNSVARNFKKYATNPFKSLITEYNPAFSIANIMRDIPTALTFSDNALSMVKKVPEAAKQMLTNGDKFKQFKALGGTREGLIGAGKQFKVPTLSDPSMMKKVGQQVNKLNPVKRIADVNKFTETLPRFSEFLAVLEKTNDPALAIYKSADLTTDFARYGNSTKLVDSFKPYLNPQVQGIDKFVRGLTKNPIKTAMGAGASITLPTIILDQVNKDDPLYNALTPRERNLYFQIPYTDNNGERQFIRIPKSRELGVAFSSIYDWASRKSRGEKVTGDEIAQTINENFSIDLAPLWTPAIKAWNQIQDPDAYETNYWGGLIVPQSQRRYSPGDQYDMNSSGIGKAIGQQFGISPFVVDYIIDSYGGVIGDFVLPIGADRKTDPLKPLTGRFKTDPVFKSNALTNFYEELDEARKESATFDKRNDIDIKPLLQLPLPVRQESDKLKEKAKELNAVYKELSNLRAEQKALQTEKGNEDKIRELQKAMNKLAEEAIK